MLADRNDTDTLGCRNRLRLYRWEADDAVRKVSDNPMDKAFLSDRVEVGFITNSIRDNTHNPIFNRSI